MAKALRPELKPNATHHAMHEQAMTFVNVINTLPRRGGRFPQFRNKDELRLAFDGAVRIPPTAEVRVDEYEGPRGIGYSIVVTMGGLERVFSHGPEDRSTDWYEPVEV